MNKKMKLLSIGAAVMLLLLSAQAVTAGGGSPSLERQLQDYFRNYANERAIVQTYLESLHGNVPAILPSQIQSAMSTLVQAMTPIISYYMLGMATPGVNGYWLTNPAPPLFTGYCISVAQGVVSYFDLLFTLFGNAVDPVDIMVTVEALFLLLGVYIPLNIAFGLGILLGVPWNWEAFSTWIPMEESWNDYGLVWYFRKSGLAFSGYEQWAQPQGFTPSWKYPKYTWVPG